MDIERLDELVAEGDWACFIGDAQGLGDVARRLLVSLTSSRRLRSNCEEMMQLCPGDMWTAVELWQIVAQELVRDRRY